LSVRIPEHGLGHHVLTVLNSLTQKEPRLGDARSLGPMMSKPLPEALEGFIMFIDRNLNDPKRFSITSKLARETISMLNGLLNNPEGTGLITYGGSESNLTALYIARELGAKKILTSAAAHASVFKAAKILRMKILKAPTDRCLRLKVSDAKKMTGSDEGVVAVLTAGNTETGCIDDIEAFHDELPEIPVIIDGAFGGLIIPFLRGAGFRLKRADFSVESVMAVGVDGHKAALTPIPSGALLLRNEDLLQKVSFSPDYMPSNKQVGLLWTRTGGAAAAFWTSLQYFGIEGFTNLYVTQMKRTLKLRDGLLSLGFEAVEPELPLICFWHPHIGSCKMLEKLWEKGWYLYRCPSLNGIRVTVLPHITECIIDEFLSDLKAVLKSEGRE
jgi:tyrosine decarboxylase/aspartate 1-decarboxylase